MRRQAGFTLIELVVFIVVTGILLSTFMLSAVTAMRNTPSVHRQWVAVQTARGCMEWYLDQFRLNGYTTYACPSTPAVTGCTVPSGYTVSVSVSCTTWNSDTTYKTLSVTVSGLASAALSMQVGNN